MRSGGTMSELDNRWTTVMKMGIDIVDRSAKEEDGRECRRNAHD